MKKLMMVLPIIVGMVIVGCNKKNDSELFGNDQGDEITYVKSIPGFGFTTSELESVGTIHNQFLQDLFDELAASNCTDCHDEAIAFMENYDYQAQEFGISNQEFYNISHAASLHTLTPGFTFSNSTSTTVSPQAAQLLDDIVNVFDDVSSYSNISQVNAEIEAICNAASVLPTNEYEIVIGTGEVAKSSCQFWAPVGLGGDGHFDDFPAAAQGPIPTGWGGAVYGDAKASAEFFMTLGVLGAVGVAMPGTNVAILGGWGLTAAIGSSLGYFGY